MEIKPVVLPMFLMDEYLEIERDCMRLGQLSWGAPYEDPNWLSDDYYAVPVASNGAGQFLLMSYAEGIGKQGISYPSNTFEGVKSIYREASCSCDEYHTDLLGTAERDPFDSNEIEVTTPIGGYLAPDISFAKSKFNIIDAAHAQYLQVEDIIPDLDSALVYSFFATKVTPIGEGGLIITKDINLYKWLIRTVMYDKPNYLAESINVRVSQATAFKMKYLLTEPKCQDYLSGNRKKLCEVYGKICDNLGVEYFKDVNFKSNGYKFLITDDRIRHVGILSTSKVFDRTEHHVCPATYPHLLGSEVNQVLEDVLKEQIQ